MIDIYEKDLPKLSKNINGLMSPEELRSITKQGRKGAAPYCGYSIPTEGSECNAGFYDAYMKGAGNLGADYVSYYKGLPKMGDTPALLYVMNGDPDNPEGESWGGSFESTKRSSRQIFHRPTTVSDTVPVYSIIEFHVKGPVKDDIVPDSVCFQLTVRNQTWDGFYLGNGDYALRHSTYYLGTLPYTVTSHIEGFPEYEGAITIENLWPGRESADDYAVGKSWYTDKAAPELFWHNLQGAETTYKWRKDVMEDWGNRLKYLK